MGKRRVRNLQALGLTELAGVDVRADRRADAESRYNLPTFSSLDDAMERSWDAVVISLPPDLHVEAAHGCVSRGTPFFVEASVVLDGMSELTKAVEASGVLAMPSCTMRYFPGPRAIGKIVESEEIGRPLFWRYHSGQYLPDWHPWESIADYYVSRRVTGGCREIVPFELTWLTGIFGDITAVRGTRGKVGDLEADIDDLYTAELRHADGLTGQLVVDVLSRPPVRDFFLLGASGAARWDGIANTLEISRGQNEWQRIELASGNPEAGYINPEEPYIAEMKDFLAAVRSGQHPAYTLHDDMRILAVLGAIERDSQASQPTPV